MEIIIAVIIAVLLGFAAGMLFAFLKNLFSNSYPTNLAHPEDLIQALCIRCENFVDVRKMKYVKGEQGGYRCIRCPEWSVDASKRESQNP